MRQPILPKIIFAAALSAGCTGTLGYSATVASTDYQPDLVYAAPGVQVIADYDQPIFYTDNYYWRNDGGTWYRSNTYRGGWGHAPPPPALVRIERPQTFVHYRPQGWSPRQQREPAVRANRMPPPRYAPPPREQRPQRGPDHRDDRDGDRGDHGGDRGDHGGDRDHRDDHR